MNRALPTIYLTRHCQTAWNVERRIQGSIDIPLSEGGLAEATAMIPLIRPYRFDRVVSSPYQRAIQTARIYAEALRTPLETHPGLRELDHGLWEGQRIDSLIRKPHGRFGDWLKGAAGIDIPEGSERMVDAQARVVRAIADIVERNSPERVLVVLHKHIRALLKCRLNGCDLSSFGEFIAEDIKPEQISARQLQRLRQA